MKLVKLFLFFFQIISIILTKRSKRTKGWGDVLKHGLKAVASLAGYENKDAVIENKNNPPVDANKKEEEKKKKKEKSKEFNLMSLIKPLAGKKIDLTNVLGGLMKN